MADELVLKIEDILESKKAKDIKKIDIKNKTTIADYFIIASGTSTTHVKSLADNLEEELKKNNVYPKKIEGYDTGSWILLDYDNIIVHIFTESERQNYSLEEINRNLPIWATYEPGSTFKIITLAAALEEGKVDLEKDTFYDRGSIKVENATIHCWKHGGHGKETFMQVVENSCNPGFVVLGQRLGKNTLFDYIDSFGFGKKTGVDLNGESSGIIFDRSKVGPVELATTAFGQGVSVTPIHLTV